MGDRSEEARLRAEANCTKKERLAEEGEKAWAEHLAAAQAADANRARLKALRLAKEASDQQEAKPAKRVRSRKSAAGTRKSPAAG